MRICYLVQVNQAIWLRSLFSKLLSFIFIDLKIYFFIKHQGGIALTSSIHHFYWMFLIPCEFRQYLQIIIMLLLISVRNILNQSGHLSISLVEYILCFRIWIYISLFIMFHFIFKKLSNFSLICQPQTRFLNDIFVLFFGWLLLLHACFLKIIDQVFYFVFILMFSNCWVYH